MEKVDAHVHGFNRVSDAFPREVSELAPAERTATVEDLLHEMDAAGVARAVLIQMGGVKPEHHRYVAKAVQRWPDRFVAAGLVDLADTDPASRLDELVQTTGAPGEGQRVHVQYGAPEDLEDIFGGGGIFSDFFTSILGRQAGGRLLVAPGRGRRQRRQHRAS